MATLDMAAKLAVLDQARLRLEAELERDEHWRALQKPLAPTEAVELASEKEARDRRLRQALDGNPVYVAWRNVVEASATLQKTGARDSQFEGLVEPLAAAKVVEDVPDGAAPERDQGTLSAALRHVLVEEEDTEAGSDDDQSAAHGLPPEIAALIREEVKATSMATPLSDSDRELHAVGERAARAVEKLLAIPSVEPVALEHLETARRADRLANELREINERRRIRSAQRDENEVATETAPTDRLPDSPSNAPDDVDFLLNPAGAPWVPFDGLDDPEESVTTVMARPAPQSSEPVAGDRQRRGSLVERLRAEETSAPVSSPASVTPSAPLSPSGAVRTRRLNVTHEAEVTVVRKLEENVTTQAQSVPTPDEKPQQRPLRRLINVLTGK